MGALSDAKVELSICDLETIARKLPDRTSHVITLVDPDTRLPHTLQNVERDKHLVIRMHDLLDPVAGKIAPERAHAEALCHFASTIRHEHLTRLVVHCHLGRSRSSAAAAIALLALGCPSAEEAFEQVVAVRDPVWPNQTLTELGDEVLGCHGALIDARLVLNEGVRLRHPRWVEDPDENNIST